jgi:hypothetical protein
MIVNIPFFLKQIKKQIAVAKIDVVGIVAISKRSLKASLRWLALG